MQSTRSTALDRDNFFTVLSSVQILMGVESKGQEVSHLHRHGKNRIKNREIGYSWNESPHSNFCFTHYPE